MNSSPKMEWTYCSLTVCECQISTPCLAFARCKWTVVLKWNELTVHLQRANARSPYLVWHLRAVSEHVHLQLEISALSDCFYLRFQEYSILKTILFNTNKQYHLKIKFILFYCISCHFRQFIEKWNKNSVLNCIE